MLNYQRVLFFFIALLLQTLLKYDQYDADPLPTAGAVVHTASAASPKAVGARVGGSDGGLEELPGPTIPINILFSSIFTLQSHG